MIRRNLIFIICVIIVVLCTLGCSTDAVANETHVDPITETQSSISNDQAATDSSTLPTNDALNEFDDTMPTDPVNHETNPVVKCDHRYSKRFVDSTCLKNGYTIYTCLNCGYNYKDDFVASIGHHYISSTVPATDQERGYDLHICDICGETYKDNYTEKEITYEAVNEFVYAVQNVNIRSGPSTDHDIIGKLNPGEQVVRIGIGNKWDKIEYNGIEAYIYSEYISTSKPEIVDRDSYPIVYSDSSCTITIERKWYYNAWCYIAHLQFSDYERFGSAVAKNQMGSYETTSAAAKRLGAIFCVNGPYMGREYAVIRDGIVHYDVKIGNDLGIYNANTGLFFNAGQHGVSGMLASDAVNNGLATDTFKFYNSTLVKNGSNLANINNYDRAQRTFIATNGNPGDIYIIVAEGRYADGESPGLRKYECAKLILDLGCTYGVMLDGGGSSTMYFKGRVLNSVAGNQRSIIDFVYLK